MTTYIISGRSDARTSSLDGQRYGSLQAAIADLRKVLPDAMHVEPGDDGAYRVYDSLEESEADADGSSACASITECDSGAAP